MAPAREKKYKKLPEKSIALGERMVILRGRW
jgi:hypothetical protein